MKKLSLVLLSSAVLAANFSGGRFIEEQINEAVSSGLIPGAVVIAGNDGKVVYKKAFGSRSLVPTRTEMSEDTIFDIASLTKVVATTSCIMKLVEEGKVRIADPVTRYLPEYQGGKSDITVRDLLVHFSGLRPDVDLEPRWSGYSTGIRLALIDKPVTPPGQRFVYSDINFLLLGEIVRRQSGKSLADYARESVFAPLGMKDTMYNPPKDLLNRIAPTEIEDGKPLHGVVHDPTARFMGGVAGHAGLFSTASDLARFADMMIGLGTRDNTKVFSPLSIRKFTTPHTPAGQPILRGLGWDMDSPYSGNRGELFPIGSFGHTGFTGTSMWIDPSTKSYVILLTNYVHPKRGKNLTALRGKIATITAAGLGVDAQNVTLAGYNDVALGAGYRRNANRNGDVQTGLDVLAAERFAALRGKRVGLITNHTGVDVRGNRNVDLMVKAGVRLVSIFAPEHGIQGKEDREDLPDAKDAATGLPIYSLYKTGTRKIPGSRLNGLDVLVFDIQDVGARFYTYSCTMIYAMEAAAEAKVQMMVLDRPNPVTGVHVEGPLLDAGLHSFVGCYELPVRHGMTLGELAQMVNDERKLGVNLKVVAAKGWQRGDWLDSTGILWRDPSPNMRSLNAATLYTGVALLEAAKTVSVGRGTDAPFEQIGADWMNGRELARALNARSIPGVRVYPTAFQPKSSYFAGKTIQGVRFVVTDREAFRPVRFGFELAVAIERLFPAKIDWKVNRNLIGSEPAVAAILRKEDPRRIADGWEESINKYLARRARYLIYH